MPDVHGLARRLGPSALFAGYRGRVPVAGPGTALVASLIAVRSSCPPMLCNDGHFLFETPDGTSNSRKGVSI